MIAKILTAPIYIVTFIPIGLFTWIIKKDFTAAFLGPWFTEKKYLNMRNEHVSINEHASLDIEEDDNVVKYLNVDLDDVNPLDEVERLLEERLLGGKTLETGNFYPIYKISKLKKSSLISIIESLDRIELSNPSTLLKSELVNILTNNKLTVEEVGDFDNIEKPKATKKRKKKVSKEEELPNFENIYPIYKINQLTKPSLVSIINSLNRIKLDNPNAFSKGELVNILINSRLTIEEVSYFDNIEKVKINKNVQQTIEEIQSPDIENIYPVYKIAKLKKSSLVSIIESLSRIELNNPDALLRSELVNILINNKITNDEVGDFDSSLRLMDEEFLSKYKKGFLLKLVLSMNLADEEEAKNYVKLELIKIIIDNKVTLSSLEKIELLKEK